MSRLVFGTAAFSQTYGLHNSCCDPSDLSVQSIKLGVRAFDTAPAYGDAESILGKALQGRGKIWTKLVNRDWERSLEKSLEHLQRKQIEVLQVHNWSRSSLDDVNFVRSWEELRNDERCVFLGASTYGVEDAVAAVASGLFDIVQVEWNLLNQGVVMAVQDLALGNGTKIAVRSIFLQGALTDEGRPLPNLPVLREGVARAQEFALYCNKSLSVMSLESALKNRAISYVIIGFESPEQIQMAVAIENSLASRTAGYFEDITALDLKGHPETDPRNWRIVV